MGGRIKGCKERGEWAEMYFMMLALEHGLKVSKPYGESGFLGALHQHSSKASATYYYKNHLQ